MEINNNYIFNSTVYFIILKSNYEHEKYKGRGELKVDGNGIIIEDRVVKGDISEIVVSWDNKIYYILHDEDKGTNTSCDYYKTEERDLFISREDATNFLNKCECRCIYGPKLKCDGECKYPGA